MTAITMPQQTDGKGQGGESKVPGVNHTKKGLDLCGRMLILIFVAMLLGVAGFTWYCTWYVSSSGSAPSCDEKTGMRSTDVTFRKHGKFSGDDFDEDCHYDHSQNVLITIVTGEGRGSNATIIDDFNRNLTTRVLRSHESCFIGALELGDIPNLPEVNDGDIQEMHNTKHVYQTTGPIAPEFLERTVSSVVLEHCSGLQTAWVKPSDSLTKRAAQDVIIIYTKAGTVIIIR